MTVYIEQTKDFFTTFKLNKFQLRAGNKRADKVLND